MIDTPSLLDNLIAFDIKVEDDNLYDLSSQQSTSTIRTPSSDFVIYSQNVNRSNVTTHAVLSIASTMSPPADIILIQEHFFREDWDQRQDGPR